MSNGFSRLYDKDVEGLSKTIAHITTRVRDTRVRLLLICFRQLRDTKQGRTFCLGRTTLAKLAGVSSQAARYFFEWADAEGIFVTVSTRRNSDPVRAFWWEKQSKEPWLDPAKEVVRLAPKYGLPPRGDISVEQVPSCFSAIASTFDNLDRMPDGLNFDEQKCYVIRKGICNNLYHITFPDGWAAMHTR